MVALAVHGDLDDLVALPYGVHDLHAARDAPEDGVFAVQVWLRGVRDEKLAPAGVGTGPAWNAPSPARAVVKRL